MEKNISQQITQIHKKVEVSEQIESTIKEVQAILWFKKIIAFWGWWQASKLEFEDDTINQSIKEQSYKIKEKIIDAIMMRLRDYDVAILTWGTNWDIPEIATRLARKYNLPTIWVLPKRWEKDSLAQKNLLNVEVVVDSPYSESQYGDESSIYAKLADAMFVLGGWAWTLIEFAHIMKMNESLYKKQGYVKKIVPIHGIWWLSEVIHHIPWNDQIKELALPKTTIHNGKDAFELLKNELSLNDIKKEDY